ncbi:MAG: hypothetical protein EHM33_29580 [Chloroflexi bacterium]|nr:MAG: hypothetical protein EHM33_29580 [Chloroflexota bacterium]
MKDTLQGDLATARRTILLETLRHERYLTGAQLATRVELRLGRGCFGSSAWQNTFYRDMRVVKQAFEAAGFSLRYSRNRQQPGYYLQGQEALSSKLRQILRSSVSEVDQRQIDIYQKLSPAERFHQGYSISDIARRVVAYRIRQENPTLSMNEANRIALERAYKP